MISYQVCPSTNLTFHIVPTGGRPPRDADSPGHTLRDPQQPHLLLLLLESQSVRGDRQPLAGGGDRVRVPPEHPLPVHARQAVHDPRQGPRHRRQVRQGAGQADRRARGKEAGRAGRPRDLFVFVIRGRSFLYSAIDKVTRESERSENDPSNREERVFYYVRIFYT